MRTQFVLSGTSLFCGVLVTDPDTEVAEDPTFATATFYTISLSGNVVEHSLGAQVLVKLQNKTGFWGVVVDVTNYFVDLETLFVFIEAIVGGDTRADFEPVLDLQSVGAPLITSTPVAEPDV